MLFPAYRTWILGLTLLAMGIPGSALPAPLPEPLDEMPDSMGAALQAQVIWAPADIKLQSANVAFRKRFTLTAVPDQATLYLFADVRYLLWINGEYVLRGPARFNPKGPEYDVAEVKDHLHAGDNEIVVLVLADQSNGKMMHHEPGLTVRINATNAGQTTTLLNTDETWKWSDQTRYRTPQVSWGNISDVIDSTVEDGDWTQLDYKDDGWKAAGKIDGNPWGPLSARRIPLLRATPVEIKLKDDQKFPLTLLAGQEMSFDLNHLVQAYTVLDFDADAGTTFELPYTGITYKAKKGRQLYITGDTHGFASGSIHVTSGKITVYSLKPVELIYPFDCAGSFNSSDPLLNRLWAVCARSIQVMSEDAYVDCADRERAEWMDCDPPDFDVTRTAMAGPAPDGGKLYADPRLLEEMLRRTALTLQPDGWVKAHTCSDRFDIHAKMEDRACDWVEGARRYYDSSGNAAPIREIWPAVVAQMQYFLDRRTSRGLVLGREWVVWGNPVGYQTCEGTGLNAFVYKALTDAAYLGNIIGKTDDATRFDQAARDLSAAFDKVLWDEQDGTYYSGYYTNPSDLPPGVLNRQLSLPVTNNLIAPNIQAAVFALDQGIVPEERRPKVTSYVLSAPDPNAHIMFYYYYFKQLYDADKPAMDRQVLDTIRKKWKDMSDSPWQTTWEGFKPGSSKAHCYGMFPGYFLSSYVLGVRLDGPAANKHLLIDPRLADLTSAEGSVVTELGLVPVSWKKSPDHLDFKFEVPEGATASVLLPSYAGKAQLVLDGAPVDSASNNASAIALEVKSGPHQGTLKFPTEAAAVASPAAADFNDDFAKDNADWQETSGSWKADSGAYRQSDDSTVAVTSLKGHSWSDAIYTFSCHIDDSSHGTHWAGFQWRKPDAAGSHEDGGYLIYIRANGDLELFARKILQTIKTGLDPTKEIRFRVVAKQDHIQVYLNDETTPRIDLHDGAFSEGHASFETYHASAAFGPLSVTEKFPN